MLDGPCVGGVGGVAQGSGQSGRGGHRVAGVLGKVCFQEEGDAGDFGQCVLGLGFRRRGQSTGPYGFVPGAKRCFLPGHARAAGGEQGLAELPVGARGGVGAAGDDGGGVAEAGLEPVGEADAQAGGSACPTR